MKIGFWLFLLIASAFQAPLLADVTENKQALSEVQSKIKQVDTAIQAIGSEKAVQLEDLKKIEKQYGELANAMLAIKADIDLHQQKLVDIRNKITVTQKEYQQQKLALAGLIKSAYAIGDQEGLKLILNQKDLGASGRMLVYLDYISKARIQKLQLIQDSFNTLHELEIQKNTETQSLQTVLKKKQIETDRMLILKNQRENLLLSLNSDYLSKSKQKERLLLDEKKLAKLVASLQKTDDNSPVEHPNSANLNPKQVINNHQDSLLALKPNTTNSLSNKVFSESQGSLAWPVAGSILEHFGSRRFETPLDGAVINAKEGADIHAVAAGRVVYAEWLRGYGLMIIVDHGHGFMSLYGYNQNLYKKNGERVSAGETLAAVGRSGGRSEASLYFGIRKNGKAINPELWCKQSTNN